MPLLAPSSAPVNTAEGRQLVPDATIAGLPSIAFDAVFVPAGDSAAKTLGKDGDALHYVLEAYKHLKAIALCGAAGDLASQLYLEADEGLISGATAKDVVKPLFDAIARHRVWAREPKAKVPA